MTDVLSNEAKGTKTVDEVINQDGGGWIGGRGRNCGGESRWERMEGFTRWILGMGMGGSAAKAREAQAARDRGFGAGVTEIR